MPFSQVPAESKKDINRAGQILIADIPTPVDFYWAIDLADKWRACHAYPINTFQATLRRKVKDYQGDPIVAQRLKRMPTIIDKLKRYPNMKLSTMQDIGGVRAVLGSIEQVNELANEYRNTRFSHELIDEKNYISIPRNEDGYRSLHLIYKYRNIRNPSYDGLRLELQLRTKLQHTWATAVETMGTFLGQSLKSRQGDKRWIDFFAITSSAFAYLEKCPPIPRFQGLSYKETASAVAKASSELGVLGIMSGLSSAVESITRNRKSWFYHLLVLNSLERTVQVTSYDRNDLEAAMTELARLEKEASEGKKIEPVLVSAGPFNVLRRAYPNFFLDIEEFVNFIGDIIQNKNYEF